MNNVSRISWFLFIVAFFCMCVTILLEFNRTQDKIDTLTEEVHQLKCSVDSLENILYD